MTPKMHPEEALYQAGASDGYYEVVGAKYTPETNTATIDLSTPEQTGCLLTHNYLTGETILEWDAELLSPGADRRGTADDMREAIGGITRWQSTDVQLFTAFRDLVLAHSQ